MPFKDEARAVAEKWGKEIDIERAPKGAETFPFPLTFSRTIPQPESAAAWDIETLIVRLKIAAKDAPETLDVKVVIGNKELPKEVRKAISAKLEEHWKADLSAGGGAWFLEDIFAWAEAKYSDLLCLCPEFMDRYDTGYSEIRYTIKEPVEEEEEDPEELARQEAELAAAAEEWERKEYEKLIRAAEKKDAEAAARRKAAEDGLDSEAKPNEGKFILSKKQADALHAAKKANKGQRLAKAPAKSHKSAAEGSKLEKEKTAAQKKKDEQGKSIEAMASRQMGNQRK